MYFLCVAVVLLLLLLDLATATDDVEEDHEYMFHSQVRLFASTAALLIASLPGGGLDADEDSADEGPKKRAPRDRARMRVRRKVKTIFREHGPYYVRRAYRMTECAFWDLHKMLQPHMSSSKFG
jgi:hypothetical protein